MNEKPELVRDEEYEHHNRSIRNLRHGENPSKLELEWPTIVDPAGWRWLTHDIAQTRIVFKAKQGYMDWDHVIAQPGLGYPGLSRGFGFYTWNQVSGTNRWHVWNQSSGDKTWFHWQKSQDSYFWPQDRKEKEVALMIEIDNAIKLPQFPTSFTVSIPDLYSGRRVYGRVIFTHDPLRDIPPADQQVNDPSYPRDVTETSQLHLTQYEFNLNKSSWTITDQVAHTQIFLQAGQGSIDWRNIQGMQKNGQGWFSWEVNPDQDFMSPKRVAIRLWIRGFEPAPALPATYWISVKDLNRDRWVRVRLVVSNNPFAHSIESQYAPKLPVCNTIQDFPPYLAKLCMGCRLAATGGNQPGRLPPRNLPGQ
jgi:hypothetical protein